MNRHSPEQPIEIEPQAESVDFDKCQIERVLEAYQQGKQVEWESFSPYLAELMPSALQSHRKCAKLFLTHG